MEGVQSWALPPNTQPGVQGKHSCEGFWATAQIINLHGCRACMSGAGRTRLPSEKSGHNRQQVAVTVYKWRAAANQDGWRKEPQHTRSGGIADLASSVHPSAFIFQFGHAAGLRHCAAYECVKHHETEFSHVWGRKCPILDRYHGIGGGTGSWFCGGRKYRTASIRFNP